MASIQLDLPLSGRLNIVQWMENFRHQGFGLKQGAIDFFDQGNYYNTNKKVKEFNKIVSYFLDSLKNAGIESKSTPKGRFSVTTKMLEKLKYEHLTDELKDFLFDEKLSNIRFDDKNIVKLLTSLYAENNDIEFNNMSYFENFALYGNLPALSWLVKTYGVEHYNLNSIKMGNIFRAMIDNKLLGESKTIDFFSSHGILKNSLNYGPDDYPSFVLRLKLSKQGFETVLPHVDFSKSKFLSTYSAFNFLYDLHTIDQSLLKLCNMTIESWKTIADYVVDKINNQNFDSFESFVISLMNTSEEIKQHMIEKENWVAYNKFINLMPEVRDIFFF